MGQFKILEVKKPKDIQIDSEMQKTIEKLAKELEKPMPFPKTEVVKLVPELNEFFDGDPESRKYNSQRWGLPFIPAKEESGDEDEDEDEDIPAEETQEKEKPKAAKQYLGIHHSPEFTREETFKTYLSKNSKFVKEVVRIVYMKYEEYIKNKVTENIGDMFSEDNFLSFVPKSVVKNIQNRPYTYDVNLEKKGKKIGDSKYKATITFPNIKGNIQLVTTYMKGVNVSWREGHTSHDVREATPIILAYQKLGKIEEYNEKKGTIKLSSDALTLIQRLGLNEPQAISILKNQYYNQISTDEKEKKSGLLLDYQSEVIKKIIKNNPDFNLYRSTKEYKDVRGKGLELLKKPKKEGGEGLSISPDHYNPSDFFLIRINGNDNTDDISEYNLLFANDLVIGENIKEGEVAPEFRYIGVSQKKGEGAAAGRAGEWFSVIKAGVFGANEPPKNTKLTPNFIKNEMESLLRFIKTAKTDIKFEITDKGYLQNFTKGSEKELYSKYKVIRNLYNICTGKAVEEGKKENVIDKKYFEDLVQFSIAMDKKITPCYYKIIGGQIHVMNPRQTKIELDLSEPVEIQFTKQGNQLLLIVPIIFTIREPGSKEHNESYQMRLPFEIKSDRVDPVVRKLINNTLASEKSILFKSADGSKLKSEKRLLATGMYTEEDKDFRKLKDLYLGEMWVDWFRHYRHMVYRWMLVKIEDGSIQPTPEGDKLAIDIKNQKTSMYKETTAREADINYKRVLNKFNNLPGVKFDKNLKYKFTEPASPTSKKNKEFLTKIDQYK